MKAMGGGGREGGGVEVRSSQVRYIASLIANNMQKYQKGPEYMT